MNPAARSEEAMANRIETWEEQAKAARAAQAKAEDASLAAARAPVIAPPTPVGDSRPLSVHDSAFGDTSQFKELFSRIDIPLGFLTIWLWILFVLANIGMGLGIGAMASGDGPKSAELFIYPAAYVVATGGFLGLIRAVQVGSRSIVKAIVASPDATAAALRKAAKSKD
jgi:hypothetical protein